MACYDSEAEGRSDVTARWRALIPALSSDPGDDLTGANRLERVKGIDRRYRSNLKRLHFERVWFGITLLSDWSPDSRYEHRDVVEEENFALSRGFPSLLSAWESVKGSDAWKGLDYALCAKVPDKEHLPRGPLFLEGVPLVVRIWRVTMPSATSVRSATGPGLSAPISEVVHLSRFWTQA